MGGNLKRPRKKSLAALLTTLILCPILVQSSETEPNEQNQENQLSEAVVETPLGRIQGRQEEFEGKKVNVYRGIPYAEPPVGDRRFKVPVPVTPRGLIDATAFSDICPGRDPLMFDAPWNEDCLYLNIWGPESKEQGHKPVLLFIHGEGFLAGSASSMLYEGLMLAAREDVVVVSINYRLGALGFLSLGENSEVRGNMGLMDQAEAIKWVKNYISLFGGDPDRITLFGGGFSIAYHLVSPITKNLFRRAIIQSGGGYGSIARFNATTYARNSRLFTDMIGCSSVVASDELRCLQETNVFTIMNIQEILVRMRLLGFLGPTIDDRFLPVSPEKLFQAGQIGQGIQEIMIGVTSDEGSVLMPLLLPETFALEIDTPHFTREEAKQIIRRLVSETLNSSEIEDLSEFYFNKYDGPLLYRAIYELYGDYLITCPAIFTSEQLADHERKVYFYEFAHRNNAIFPLPMLRRQWMGVRHFEEIPFVFGIPLRHTRMSYTEAEVELSRKVMNIWATFAKTGNPSSQYSPGWPLFTKEAPRFLRLKLPEFEEGVGFHANNCEQIRPHITTTPRLTSASEAVVETPIGRIHGRQEEFEGKKVNVYRGIPYAEPPVGDRRFKAPVPVKPRDSIEATAFSDICPGRDPLMFDAPWNEDCLYLNIWSPESLEQALKPVLLWIHGGGFLSGSSSSMFYEGLMLAAREDVVVVSINYRLGALGFLSLGENSEVRGNMGLMDQAEAIKWVKNYISLFGGDPEQITLFGESAGGFSIAYHLVSPMTKNLFRRAIIQSGAGHGNIARFNATTYARNSRMFIDMIGCSSEVAADELRCLQEANVSAIMNTQDILVREHLLGFLTPTTDGRFLPDSPENLFQADQIGQGIQEIMIGVTSDEGSVLMPLLVPEKFANETDVPHFTREEANHIMRRLMLETLNPSEIEELSEFFFTKYDGPLLYKAIYELYGDYLIACPAIFTSEQLADHDRKVYFYEFAHRSNATFPLPMLRRKWMGARHFEEIPFVFGIPLRHTHDMNYTEAEVELSRKVMDTWATFAKTGNPSSQLNREWPLFTKQNPRFLRVKLPEFEEGVGFHADNCEQIRSHITTTRFLTSASEAVIETPIGRIDGRQEEFEGKKVNVYRGIPYAEPPVGDRRFKAPVPVKPRDSIDATAFSDICPGRDPLMFDAPWNEDCLYLNIWSPESLEQALKPVLLWIHGGGFLSGSSSSMFYEGLMLAAREDVVVVSINYRLGALGFLSLGENSEVRGNMGLMDQAEAIKWVKNYISLFGGDPEQITLFGESAGGFSIAYHLVSPMTKNLFRRAIIQSGAGHGNIARFNATTYATNSRMFIDMIGCSSEVAADELRCLQEANVSAIMNTQDILVREHLLGFLTPTTDGRFLPDSPENLFQADQIGQGIQEIMIGVTSDEGSVLMPLLVPEKFANETDVPHFTREEANHIMRRLMLETLNPSEIEELSEFFFTKYDGPLLYKAIYELYGDYLIACPAIFTSEQLADHDRKVYFYEFAHRSNATFPLPMLRRKWMGARHFEEIPFVFGIPLRHTHDMNYTEAEVELSRKVMDTWATFAKTGNPSNQLNREWPLFTKQNPRFLRLKLPEFEEGVGFHADNCEQIRSHITTTRFLTSASEAVIETPIGRIHGRQEEFEGKKVNVYRGIPYAEPPVGDRRFKAPVPVKPRVSIDATAFSDICPGRDPLMFDAPWNEDCLYLNIWSPESQEQALKPVLLWIHGGGFLSGSSSSMFYEGLMLAAREDVVVVSINYRLGALGFLSLGENSEVRGNMGLMDQAEAIKWVKNYISLFGGDPEQITLFGESAGGFSIAYHLVSPMTKNLFRRAIIQSGAGHGNIARFNATTYARNSRMFIDMIGCSSEVAADELRCLQEANVSAIMNTQDILVREHLLGFLTPTTDGRFLPDSPENLFQADQIGQGIQEIMIGVTSDEGSVLMPLLVPEKFANETDVPHFTREEANHIMRRLMLETLNPSEIEELSEFFFTKYDGPLLYKAVYELYGDYLIACPAIFTSEQLADHERKVYFYEFAHRSNATFPLPMLRRKWMGARHFEEIPFVFGIPLRHTHDMNYTEAEVELSRKVMDTWATFAKTGNPSSQLNRQWPLFTKKNPRFLRLKLPEFEEGVGFHADNCEQIRSHITTPQLT